MADRSFYKPCPLLKSCIATDWRGHIQIPMMLRAKKNQDWANLNKYKDENKKIKTDQNRILFFGDSITEAWQQLHPAFFSQQSYINRGISGQTSAQMLLRFRPDVIALQPKMVIILAGTNDIAQNTGAVELETILGNLISFCELSKSNQIQVALCSVLPALDYPWRTGLEPSQKIIKLNHMIETYARENRIDYVDYYSAMVDERQAMKAAYSEDGVHPNGEGYTLMEAIISPLLESIRS